MSEDAEVMLLAEQFRHTIDLLRTELHSLRAEQEHAREVCDHRLETLEEQARDHEVRLRVITDGVTQVRVWSGLASGGSGIMSLIAIVRTWLGG